VPNYTYKCTNIECENYENNIEHYVSDSGEIFYCIVCKEPLQRLFPLNVHVVGAGREKDGKDLGKVTREKNEKLKKMWSGYSHEEQNLREKVSKQADKILQKNNL